MRTRKKVPERIEGLIADGKLELHKVNTMDRFPTIGFYRDSSAWFAWNHKVCNMFYVGSSVKVGNCAYTEEKGEWTAKTIDDAKQMAIDFARGVASK